MAHYKSKAGCQEVHQYRFGAQEPDLQDQAGSYLKKRWPFILLLGVYIKVRSDQVARGR